MIAKKLMALTSKQPAMPITPISTPPKDGPMIFAKFASDELSAMAFIKSARGTMLLISEWRAVWLSELTMPRNSTSTSTCQNSTQANCTRTQKTIACAMAKNCVHSSSRRRSTRSTMAPPTAPKSKRGSAWAKPTTPSRNGDLVICPDQPALRHRLDEIADMGQAGAAEEQAEVVMFERAKRDCELRRPSLPEGHYSTVTLLARLRG